MRLFKRKSKRRLHELGESEAYHHSYGEPPRDVKLVKLPPRRPRYRQGRADGERPPPGVAPPPGKRDQEGKRVRFTAAIVGRPERGGPGGGVGKVGPAPRPRAA